MRFLINEDGRFLLEYLEQVEQTIHTHVPRTIRNDHVQSQGGQYLGE